MRAIFRLGVFSFLLTGLSLLTVGTAGAISTGGVGGRPANPDPNIPRSQSIFIYTLKQGEEKKDQVFINNASDSEQTVIIYAVDGTTTNTGAFTCKQKVEPRNGIGKWLKLSKKEVTLEAKANTLVDFTLTMPANADVGEHNGCIVFQDKRDNTWTSGALQVHSRQAVRVATVVPGKINRNVTITSFDVKSTSKSQRYVLYAKNVGNVSADVDSQVVVSDLFGHETKVEGGSFPVLANTELEVIINDENRPLWGGWYRAQATISYDKRAGQFGTGDESQLVHKKSETIIFFIMPSLPAILIIVAVLALLGFLYWRFSPRRRRQASRAKSGKQRLWGKYTVKSGDSLSSLATKYKVSPQKLMSINRLVSDELRPGRVIYVPKGYKK